MDHCGVPDSKTSEHTVDIANIYGLFSTLEVWIQKSKKVLTETIGFHFGYK